MKLEYVPLLRVQRDLYQMPRGFERFREYLATMIDAQTRDIRLPLVAMNPMGKDHVPALLDELLTIGADQIAADAVADAAPAVAQTPGEFKVALVVADDLMGGWTNRHFTEFGRRFGSKPYHQRGWLEGGLWTSERPSAQQVREEVLTTVHRAAHIQRHGFAQELGGMMRQEGYAMAAAGCRRPTLDEEDMAYTREVTAAHLEVKDQPTVMACLYGDEAARSLGYKGLGLSERAGLALALYDAQVGMAMKS